MAKGLSATGYEAPDGFVVREGAEAQRDPESSINNGEKFRVVRETLKSQGLLIEDGDRLRLTDSYTFSSPSAAASVLLARPANGRTEWKDEAGRTLKEIQNSETGL